LTRGDVRSRQVAVVSDSLLPGLLDLLDRERWGVIQLPPAGLEPATAADWLEQVAEHVAEFRRNGYTVVLASDGLYDSELESALRSYGVAPLRRWSKAS
jgi:hypothetical protein